MPPFFDLQGGAALAAARCTAVTGLLSAFGTILFRVLVAPKAFELMQPDGVAASRRHLNLLAQGSIAVAVAGFGFWLVTQAAFMADAGTLGAAFAAVPEVLDKTSFGHVILLQSAALLLLAVSTGWRDTPMGPRASLVLISVALSLQSGHSHAFSMQSGFSLLLACDVLHLAGAGAWLGGLVPLLLMVRSAPPNAAATAARWFSPLGQASIAALVASAMVQGWVLVASIPGLIGTAYGLMILLKLALFGVLFGFAWFNRYRFAPALVRDDPATSRRILSRSIALQTVFALVIISAAAVLSELPPAMHLQAIWPFAQRFSLAAVTEDADFRREVLLAGAALAAAVAVVALSLVLRRWRLAALASAVAVARFALPHLDVLLVTAYPTSFYHSPTGFTAASIVDGQGHFAQDCVSCHGPKGAGDGIRARSLHVPPADLTAAHLWMHSDGELFWWISHGMVTPEGEQIMPGFAAALDEDARWALIDFIRANNAGITKRATGEWQHPVKEAEFGITCGDRALKLSDLRGQFIRLVFGAAFTVPDPSMLPPPMSIPAKTSPAMSMESGGVTTVMVAPQDGTNGSGACITRDETVPLAAAILSGVKPAEMAGMQFLVDPDGWLRAEQPPGGAPSWNDPDTLAAEIVMLRKHKIAATDGASEMMKMPMGMPM